MDHLPWTRSQKGISVKGNRVYRPTVIIKFLYQANLVVRTFSLFDHIMFAKCWLYSQCISHNNECNFGGIKKRIIKWMWSRYMYAPLR